MPRFVILRHAAPPEFSRPDHYDLMFEQGQVLWTWACAKLPDESGSAVEAERLPDHRPLYLDFEGEVSGGRGVVRRVDDGEYDLLSCEVAEICIRLRSTQRECTWILTLEDGNAQRWRIALIP